MGTSLTDRRVRVIIAAEHWLVAESVRAALATHGHAARSVRWPTPGSPPPPRAAGRTAVAQVGLLVSDLDRWSRVRASRLVLTRIPTQWVVITNAPRGPSWGAVLEAGARTVLPGNTGLDAISEVLGRMAADGGGAMSPSERARLLRSWVACREERRQVAERLRSLTPREQEVLRLLYAGESVATIAARSEVSPATVRSQVKSVLRKLDVNSQLGAVALLGQMLRLDRDSLPVPWQTA